MVHRERCSACCLRNVLQIPQHLAHITRRVFVGIANGHRERIDDDHPDFHARLLLKRVSRIDNAIDVHHACKQVDRCRHNCKRHIVVPVVAHERMQALTHARPFRRDVQHTMPYRSLPKEHRARRYARGQMQRARRFPGFRFAPYQTGFAPANEVFHDLRRVFKSAEHITREDQRQRLALALVGQFECMTGRLCLLLSLFRFVKALFGI
ncbi:hypothetical protein M3I56_27720 [Paraburkholderia sp. CNPSo 3281]|nr:hypothetical protein [Paraburkholderia sp. CNPSo 3281]MCP3719124.1 hypothetical protein [Paraburkholderia sp. CNPSo 3281]